MSAFQAKLLAAFIAFLIVVQSVACSFGNMTFGNCMRSSGFKFLVYVLNLGSLALGVWLGMVVARRSKRAWLGWVIGIAAVFAMGIVLNWLGFPYSASGRDPDFEV